MIRTRGRRNGSGPEPVGADPRGQDGPDTDPGRRPRRLWLLMLLGLVVLTVAAVVRIRVASNPLLRMPPIEDSEVRPAVAKALQLAQDRILKSPESDNAWGEYGLVLFAHGFRKEAEASFLEAERLAPEDYRWSYYFGMVVGVRDSEAAWQAFRRAVDKAPERLTVRMRLAEWCFDLRRMPECERQTREALRRDPNYARAQLMMARLLFQRGDVDESLPWAEQAAQGATRSRRDVHELLARIYQRLGNREAAAAEVHRAGKLPQGVAVWDDPEMGRGATYLQDATVLNTLAQVCRARGDIPRYLQMLRQVLESDPDNVQWQEQLAEALIEANQLPEAVRFLDSVRAAHPESSQLALLRGRVHLAQGEIEPARRCFQQAVDLKHDYGRAYDYLGRALLAQDKAAQAVGPLRKAIQLNPGQPEPHDFLGRALAVLGKNSEAATAFDQAVALSPRDAELRVRLARVLYRAERREEARRQIGQALAIAPNSISAKKLREKIEKKP